MSPDSPLFSSSSPSTTTTTTITAIQASSSSPSLLSSIVSSIASVASTSPSPLANTPTFSAATSNTSMPILSFIKTSPRKSNPTKSGQSISPIELTQSKLEALMPKSKVPSQFKAFGDDGEKVIVEFKNVEVAVYLGKNSVKWEPRTLLLTESFLKEYDPTKDIIVKSIERRSINKVERSVNQSKGEKNGKPQIYIQYKQVVDNQELMYYNCVYIMDPIGSRDYLFQILEFKKTHKPNGINKEKELNNLYELARKSMQSKDCKPSSNSTSNAKSTTASLLDDDFTDNDFDFDDSEDVNFSDSYDSDEEQISLTDIEIQRRLDRAIGESDISSEVYFHVNLYSKTEKTILFLKCGYVAYDISQSFAHEKTMVFLLTTERVFILHPSNSGFEVVHSIPFSEIMYITIGLFFQYFRLELAKGGSHVFLTRSFRDTEKCYFLLVATAKVAGNGAILFSKVHKNEEILSNISTIIPRPEHTLLSPKKPLYVKPFLELYILVYFVPPPETSWTLPNPLQSAYTFTPNIKLPQKVTPNSLIIADDHILLAKENFACWPTLNHNPVTKLNHVQFTVTQKHPFQSIHLLTTSPKKRNYLKITFTGEEGISSEWELYTQCYDEMDKIISRISTLWQDMFQFPLQILTETSTK